MTDHERIADLVFKSLTDSLDGGEREVLNQWLAASPANRKWFGQIQEEEYLRNIWVNFHGEQAQASKARVLSSVEAGIMAETSALKPAHRVHFLKTAWFRYAAAILLIVTAVGIYYGMFHTSQPGTKVVQNTPPSVPGDVLPGSDRAILTLSNGQQVELNYATSETIKDGTLSIENNNGQLIYKKGDRVAMNTMTTPKGGQYQLTLADGTRVWLNAASSITYPTAFTGNTREVTITGEAYFEVKPDKEKPFIVKTAKEGITVLGTAFNVNAYADEPGMKTSLVEGTVKVGKVAIKPGQAYLNGKVTATDLDQDVAWKNGVFNFNKTKLEDAMKQIARWYDVEVRYEGKMQSIMLGGKIGRRLTLEQLMRGLEGIDDVHFQLSGRTLIVKP